MDIALYFGSFNPIHFGHISIAEYMLKDGFCDKLWLVVSPHNPLKDASLLSDEKHRLNMCELAIEQSNLALKVIVCDIEFSMPKPSWTIDTLKKLISLYPQNNFSIVIGADNLMSFKKWKNWEEILSLVKVYVYPRTGYDISEKYLMENIIYMENAPIFDIDSTTIRQGVSNMEFLEKSTCKSVIEYIKNNNIYG